MLILKRAVLMVNQRSQSLLENLVVAVFDIVAAEFFSLFFMVLVFAIYNIPELKNFRMDKGICLCLWIIVFYYVYYKLFSPLH